MIIKKGDNIQCERWLAKLDNGWQVKAVDGGYVTVAGWVGDIHIPLAECTIVERPLQVGDRVYTSFGRESGTIVAIDDGSAWVKYDLHHHTTYLMKDLKRFKD